MTIRSHDQFNTTIYGLNDRYRGVYNGRRVVFMNSDDIKAAGLQQGQFVDLTSHHEGEERVARHFMIAPSKIARGCTATYFPEANVLVPNQQHGRPKQHPNQQQPGDFDQPVPGCGGSAR